MSATTPASIPATGSWKIDETHSTATFTLAHNVVATFRGGFHGITGGLEDGVLSGSLPVGNLDVPGPAVFKEHLLGEGFFDAASHPTLSFRSDDLHAHGDGSVHATGELTIKGVTKPITADGSVRGPLEVTLADGSIGERLGITLTTRVDRRDYGMTVFAGADWDVTIEVALQFGKS
ncbi:MAG TPA: YceI family protein [Solirubrobacteraceae bacterium]|nr:YceI family protein [Solirubrobacteraceae bacterium]